MSNEFQTEPQLPVLQIEVRGEVVTSNAVAFMTAIREWLATFKTDLKTDEDFSQAESNAKLLAEKEKAITTAKEKALADAEQINDLLKTLGDGSEEIRQKRLALEKLVKAKKEEIRDGIIKAAIAEIANGHGEAYRVQIGEAIKGKRSLSSIREAVGVVVITANGTINANRQLLAAHYEAHGNDLIPDRSMLEMTETPALLTAELASRIERKAAAEEKRRLEADAIRARAEADEARRREDAAKAEAQKQQQTVQAEAKPVQDSPFAEVVKPAAPAPVAAPRTIPGTTSIGRPTPEPTALPEWDAWLDAVADGAGAMKAARVKLANPENATKAQRFSEALNAAYKEMVG